MRLYTYVAPTSQDVSHWWRPRKWLRKPPFAMVVNGPNVYNMFMESAVAQYPGCDCWIAEFVVWLP